MLLLKWTYSDCAGHMTCLWLEYPRISRRLLSGLLWSAAGRDDPVAGVRLPDPAARHDPVTMLSGQDIVSVVLDIMKLRYHLLTLTQVITWAWCQQWPSLSLLSQASKRSAEETSSVNSSDMDLSASDTQYDALLYNDETQKAESRGGPYRRRKYVFYISYLNIFGLFTFRCLGLEPEGGRISMGMSLWLFQARITTVGQPLRTTSSMTETHLTKRRLQDTTPHPPHMKHPLIKHPPMKPPHTSQATNRNIRDTLQGKYVQSI